MRLLDVILIVAVDENGYVETIPKIEWLIQAKRKYESFLEEKRFDKNRKWKISYISARVPLPYDELIDSTFISSEK